MRNIFFSMIVILASASLLADDRITYEDQVLPILRNSCLKCHNPDKAKADLDLSSYRTALKGSGNGKVLVSGDPDGSKLIKAILQTEEPTMPPNGKMADKEIELIKKWVAGGLLENSGSKAVAMNKSAMDLTAVATAIGKPEGPPPMPEESLLEPVTHTQRTSVSTAMAASPWAPLVALGGQRQVLLYNTDTLELAGVLPFPEGYPSDLKFSLNGKLLICGGGRGSKSGLVAIWDVVKAERVLTVGDEFDSVLTADISADQKWISLGGPSRVVKVFSTKDGGLAHKMKKHTDWITAVAFSPDSKLLATGDRNGGLIVWEAETGEEVFTLAGHKASVTRVSWRSADVLVSSSEDGTVKIWTMEEGQQAKAWNAHTAGTLWLASTHDGRLATCGRDRQFTLWSASGARQRSIACTNDIPVRVAFSNDGSRVIGSDWLGDVYVWNVSDGKQLGELSLDPPPLADRIRQAEERIESLTKDQDADAAVKLDAAKATLEQLKAGKLFAELYQAREEFSKKKLEQDRLAAEATAADEAIKQAAADLATTKKLSPKTNKERTDLAKRMKALNETIRAESARASSTRKSANNLAKEIASEKERVERLTADYQRLRPARAASRS